MLEIDIQMNKKVKGKFLVKQYTVDTFWAVYSRTSKAGCWITINELPRPQLEQSQNRRRRIINAMDKSAQSIPFNEFRHNSEAYLKGSPAAATAVVPVPVKSH